MAPLLVLLSFPMPGAAAAVPSMQIHLRLSGAYQYAGTFTHVEGIPQENGCAVTHEAQGDNYNLDYNGFEVIAVFKGKVKHDSFALTAHGYKRGTRYSSTKKSTISLMVIVHKRAYVNNARFPNRVTVHIAQNGLSGTVTARQLTPFTGSPHAQVNLQANWTCDTLK